MRLVIAMALAVIVAACGGPTTPSGPPVVVYASEDDAANLPELFTAFTADTGVPISAQWGDARANADAVIEKRGLPADVLITPGIADIWRAADQGALRPIQAPSLVSVPEALKDPDNLWVALERRVAIIALSPAANVAAPVGYAELADGKYQGKLCLSSVQNAINQSLIAMLIEDHGLKPAERIVRGWVRNLAAAPFETEEMLREALAAGDCQLGIGSAAVTKSDTTATLPHPLYYDVSAMGVGRHAQSAARAQQLIDWLIRHKPLDVVGQTNGRNIGVAGWRNEEVLLLADRVSYR